MRSILAALLVLSVSGCESPEDHALEVVRTRMKDPNSAQFRDVRVVPDENKQLAVCGEVNAKNSMGGYVGFVPFMVKDDAVVILDERDKELALAQLSHFKSCTSLPPDSISDEERESMRVFTED